MDEKYFKLGEKRIKEATAQPSLFTSGVAEPSQDVEQLSF